MSLATLSLIGIYNYDNTIFDELTVPAGLDKDTLVNNILFRSGDFEVLYPDPDFLKPAIGVWSKKWNRTFSKWYEALQLVYDPISNYDRKEEWTTDDTGTQSSSSTDHSESDGGTHVDNKRSAFDSEALVNDTSADSTNNLETDSTSNLNGQHANKEVKKGRAYGNIGVTTSQQMIQSELELAEFNVYERMTDIFLSEFIIPIY